MLSKLIDDKVINENDRIAVGVSGGADSMLLLSSLLEKQKSCKFYLKAIHVNHHLRNEESNKDSEFVEAFCKNNQLDYKIIDVDVNINLILFTTVSIIIGLPLLSSKATSASDAFINVFSNL